MTETVQRTSLTIVAGALFFCAFYRVAYVSASEFGSVLVADTPSVCARIERAILLASAMFYPGELLWISLKMYAKGLPSLIHVGSPGYSSDISHFVVTFSQQSECTVEPGSNEDGNLGGVFQD